MYLKDRDIYKRGDTCPPHFGKRFDFFFCLLFLGLSQASGFSCATAVEFKEIASYVSESRARASRVSRPWVAVLPYPGLGQ